MTFATGDETASAAEEARSGTWRACSRSPSALRSTARSVRVRVLPATYPDLRPEPAPAEGQHHGDHGTQDRSPGRHQHQQPTGWAVNRVRVIRQTHRAGANCRAGRLGAVSVDDCGDG